MITLGELERIIAHLKSHGFLDGDGVYVDDGLNPLVGALAKHLVRIGGAVIECDGEETAARAVERESARELAANPGHPRPCVASRALILVSEEGREDREDDEDDDDDDECDDLDDDCD